MDEAPQEPESGDDAHDVLAAEEFALPAADPSITHPPVELPEDPSGIDEPHDVLAAEEFALPASSPHPAGPAAPPRRGSWRILVAVGVGVVAVVVLRVRGKRAS